MVRHAVAKKRRSGRKVTRKSLPKNVYKKVANAVKDPGCKEQWDIMKTPKDNLMSMGLDPDPNAILRAGKLV